MSALSAFARSAPRVLVGSAAARSRELREMDAVVRTPVPLSRRIAVVQESGGAGASSAAAYVANLLARRRSGPVLGVDASAGAGMLWHAGIPSSAETRPGRVRRVATRSAEAVEGLPRSGSGLWALDLRAAEGGERPIDRPASTQGWYGEVGPIARFFDVVVTDWGVREPGTDLGQVVAGSHAVCVVSRADRHAVERAAALANALREIPDAPGVALALVDVGGTAGPARRLAAGAPAAVTIPHDAARGSARPLASSALATSTRVAYLRLASALVALAQQTGSRR